MREAWAVSKPEDTGGPGDNRSRTSRAALLASAGAGFATLFDSSVIAYTAPSVADTLGAGASGVQWFLSAYSLTFGLGLVPAGRLGDAYGRRNLLIIGLSLFIAGIVFSASAPGIPVLVTGRLVQGMGAGFISAQVLGLIQDHFSGVNRVRALGAYTAAGAAAAMAGPPLAGALLLILPEGLGWRGVLLLPIPLAAAVILIAARGLPAGNRRRAPVALDLPGIAALGAIVVLITLPAIDPGLPVNAALALFASAIALAIGLSWWERHYARRGRTPIFAPALMRSRGFITGNLIASLWFGALIAAHTALTIYLLQVSGIAALSLALLLIPAALTRFIAARLASRFYARIGALMPTIGIAVEALSLGALALVVLRFDGPTLIGCVVALQIVTGFSSGLVEPPLRALTLSHASPDMNGLAASFLQLTQRIAATLLVALCTGLLLSDGSTSGSLAAVLLLSATLTGIAAVAALSPSFRQRSDDNAA